MTTEHTEQEVLGRMPVAQQQGGALATAADASATMLSVISRAAADPQTDVEKMERLLAMYERMQMQEAQAKFNEAMARVQSAMRRVRTDKRNDQTKSNYATYGALDRALRPLYTAEGFALSFDTEPTELPDIVRVTCHVTQSGYTRKYGIDMPADGKGAKGNDVMTKTHATGSATQYGQRYLLKLIFNVAIGDDPADDDGNGASRTSVQTISEQQEIILRDLIAEYITNEESFFKWIRSARDCQHVEKLSDIPANRFDAIHNKLNEIRKDKEAQA